MGQSQQGKNRTPTDNRGHRSAVRMKRYMETETVILPTAQTRETSQAVERRPGQILERHDMAEDRTRHGHLETTC